MTEPELPPPAPPKKQRWPLVVAISASLVAVGAVSALVAVIVTDDSTESNNQTAETETPVANTEPWDPQATWAGLTADEQVETCTSFMILGDTDTSLTLQDSGLTSDEAGETTAIIRNECGPPWIELTEKQQLRFCYRWDNNEGDERLYDALGMSSALIATQDLAEAHCIAILDPDSLLSPEERIEKERELREQRREFEEQREEERRAFRARSRLERLKSNGDNLCPEFRRLGEYDFAFWLRENLVYEFPASEDDPKDRLSVSDSEYLAAAYAEEC